MVEMFVYLEGERKRRGRGRGRRSLFSLFCGEGERGEVEKKRKEKWQGLVEKVCT